MIHIQLTKREQAAVLVGLHLLSDHYAEVWDNDDLANVLTDGESFPALNLRELEDLASDINGGNVGIIALVLEGGVLQSVVGSHSLPPDDIMVIDYDTDGIDPKDITLVPQPDGSEAKAWVYFPLLGTASIDLEKVLHRATNCCNNCGKGGNTICISGYCQDCEDQMGLRTPFREE